MKRGLIVNADDFGFTEKINEAIVEGHEKGIITSATLLANGVAFDSAVALAHAHPDLGVGVHLNLTHGRPVSRPLEVPSLTDNRPTLVDGPFALARKIMRGEVTSADMEKELRAQIEKILASGIEITHLDGHQHVHALPAVFDLVVKLAREYQIKSVRCLVERSPHWIQLVRAKRRAGRGMIKQHLLGRAISILASGQRKKLDRARLAYPQHLYGITQTGFLDADVLDEILRALPDGTSELVCHPGYVDAALRNIPVRLLHQRETELRALTRPETKVLVGSLGIELITYRDLVVAP